MPSSLSNKLFFYVGSTLILTERETENMVWKADFEKKITTCQILKKTRQKLSQKFYNASIFGLKKLQRVRFWIKKIST